MPALQFSAQNLSNLLASNQAVNAKNAAQPSQTPTNNGAKNQFSSLLDIVGAADDTTQNNSAQNNNKLDKKSNDSSNSTDNNNTQDANKKPLQSRSEKNDTTTGNNKKAVVRSSGSQHYLTRNSAKNNDTAKTAEPSVPKSENDKNNAAATQAQQQKIDDDNNAKKLVAPIDSAGGLLNIIASFLASTVAPVTNSDVTATNDIQETPNQIFGKLQQDLADLQNFIKTANVDGARTLSDAQNNELTQINNALAGDLAALKNLLAGKNGADLTIPQSINQLPDVQQQVGSAGQNIQSPVDNKLLADAQNLLQSDISLIKDALQKLKDAKSTKDDAPVKNTAQIFGQQSGINTANSAQSPKPNQSTTENNKPAEHNKDNSAQAAQILQVSQQNHQPNNQVQNTNIAANAAVAGVVNSATENNSGGFSQNNSGGQNNNLQGQFSVGVSSATSAVQNSGEVNKSTFSNILSRTTQSNQANVAEQVVFQVKTTLKTGDSKISIQLHPEDLGKVDIAMEVGANGKTSVSITADNKQTLDLLQSDSKGLQKALADAGLKADSGSLSFNLRGGQGEGSGGNQGQNQAQAANNYRKSYIEEEPILPAIATVTRNYTVQLPDGLDIKI